MPQKAQISRVKPPVLRPGDTVAIVAPASNIQRAALESGCAALRRLGYDPIFNETIFAHDLYFAGSVERRARELEEMFERDDVRAIVCARGGYGSNYLLEVLDLSKIAAHPKVFVGYSDVTTLLTWFADSAGFVTFHGPMVTKDFTQPDGIDQLSWDAALSGIAEWSLDLGPNCGVKPLCEGAAEGILYGGCLSMLVASLGTPFEIQTSGSILFIEDIATKPFQIDRMLMQLKLAGKFRAVRGIVFGEMIDCIQTKDQGYTLEEVVLRILADLDIPIAYGLRSGHVTRGNIMLPIGVRAALEVRPTDVALRILEPATTSSPVQAHSHS